MPPVLSEEQIQAVNDFPSSYRDVAEKALLALEEARHELTTVNGLWVTDQGAGHLPEWQLDMTTVLAKLDEVIRQFGRSGIQEA